MTGPIKSMLQHKGVLIILDGLGDRPV